MDTSGLYRAVTARRPPSGDHSFPGNQAAIAGAAAVALVMAARRLAPLVVPLALLMAFSRVFVGVHYCCWAGRSPRCSSSRSPVRPPWPSARCGRAGSGRACC